MNLSERPAEYGLFSLLSQYANVTNSWDKKTNFIERFSKKMRRQIPVGLILARICRWNGAFLKVLINALAFLVLLS